MTEGNASLKMAIEAIRADERASAWAMGYAACRGAMRAELEWQRAEIERLRVALQSILDEAWEHEYETVYTVRMSVIDDARRALEQSEGKK